MKFEPSRDTGKLCLLDDGIHMTNDGLIIPTVGNNTSRTLRVEDLLRINRLNQKRKNSCCCVIGLSRRETVGPQT